MSKTLPGYRTILILPAVEVNGVPWIVTPTGLVDYTAPTAAALNVYQAITKPSDTNASQGGNISQVVIDDLALGLTASDIDNTKTVCSKNDVGQPTLYNFDAKLNAKRDAAITGDSTANLFRDLFRAPDVAYFIADRVRGQKDSTETFAIGDEVDLYYVNTDNPIPDYGDKKYLIQKVEFIQKGIVNTKFTLTA